MKTEKSVLDQETRHAQDQDRERYRVDESTSKPVNRQILSKENCKEFRVSWLEHRSERQKQPQDCLQFEAMVSIRLSFLLLVFCPIASPFVHFLGRNPQPRSTSTSRTPNEQLYLFGRKQETAQLDINLNDQKVESLYAWICKAFEGEDERYNNLLLAVVAVFGISVDERSEPIQMLRQAEKDLKSSKEPSACAYSQLERESASLGAMGANQWMGYFSTRPHALLSIGNFTDVEEWKRTLPRGCRRTLKRATDIWAGSETTTVVDVPIVGGTPAPHATMDHFRCVLYHELRVIMGRHEGSSSNPNVFINALSEAVGRYLGTTRMTGQITEYSVNSTLVAFAHTVRKGRTLRGQWFYAADPTQYVWFDSVARLVASGIADPEIDTVDLGPSGSDSFSQLKTKYGFESVRDWTAVAEYRGAFWDYEKNQPSRCRRLDESGYY